MYRNCYLPSSSSNLERRWVKDTIYVYLSFKKKTFFQSQLNPFCLLIFNSQHSADLAKIVATRLPLLSDPPKDLAKKKRASSSREMGSTCVRDDTKKLEHTFKREIYWGGLSPSHSLLQATNRLCLLLACLACLLKQLSENESPDFSVRKWPLAVCCL